MLTVSGWQPLSIYRYSMANLLKFEPYRMRWDAARRVEKFMAERHRLASAEMLATAGGS
jgi:hypothetical protein